MKDYIAAIQSDDADVVSQLINTNPALLNAVVDADRSFTALYLAAGYGRASVVAELLRRGADFNTPCSGGGRPIHVATSGNHVPSLKLLVDAGCPVDMGDEQGNSPLIYANDALDATKWLVEHGADVNANDGQPLANAIHHFQYDVAKFLCEHGAEATLEQHIALGHTDLVAKSISDNPDSLNAGSENEPLLEVARIHRQTATVELLRERCPDYDFYTAAFIGDAERVSEAIAQDAEVVNSHNTQNQLPVLLHAAMGAQDHIVELLLDKGADIRARDQLQRNLLHIACQSSQARHDSQSTVALALDRGVDVRSTFRKGMTALHTATWLRDADTVRLLLQRGADADQCDERGNRPLDMCGTRHHNEVREILKTATRKS